MTPQQSDLTQSESRQLRIMKIGLALILSLFAINALLVHATPEAFPITRWAMYSQANDPPLAITEYELEFVDVDGNAYTVSARDIFRGTGVSKTLKVGQRTLFDAIDIYGANMPERQASAQATIIEHLSAVYGVAIAETRVWRVTYDISVYSLPALRETPVERVVVGRF